MTSGLQIRPPAGGDLPAVARLLGDLGYPTSLAQARNRLVRLGEDNRHATWVAQLDDRVVGLAGARLAPRYERDDLIVELVVLVVEQGHRRRGVGAALVAFVERWASEHGAGAVQLETSKRRHGTHAFYRGLGYSDDGLLFVRDLRLAH